MRRRHSLPPLTSALCLAAASAASGVATCEIRAPRRGRAAAADARSLALYLDHVGLGASLSACGRAMARDRASVRHACARVEDRRDDDAFDRAVTALEAALRIQMRLVEALAHSFLRHQTGDDQ